MKKAIIAGFGMAVFSCSFAFAGPDMPPMRYCLLYNNDIRHGDENFWASRLEAFFKKDLSPAASKYEITGKLMPFIEQRYSIDRRKRERTMAGIELGLEAMDFLYIAEQFRHVWRSEAVYNRGVIENTNMPEAVSIITLSFWLFPDKKIFKGYISAEYTYDFRLGRGARVESIAGLLIPVDKSLEISMDWRHRDRIHSDDCDTLEAGVSYNF